MPPVTEQPDSALVELTRGGNAEAFAELWRRHSRAAHAVARSQTSTFDADDLISEAYVKIYQAIAAGGGPTAAFRPYLFTTVRNLAASWGRSRHETAYDEMEAVEDPAFSESATMEALDRSLTAKAFHSLPTRWQEVLWYCEVESLTPQQVAPLFGMTPNAVAALAYRAREGLRQAWIQAHLASLPERSECRWTTERLGSYARHGLGKRDTAAVEAHLRECPKCTIVASEASEVGSRLSLVLLPLTLGIGGAAAYSAWLQSGAGTAAYALGASGAVAPGSAAPTPGTGGSAGSGASAGSSAASGGMLGIGLTITGVLVAASVSAGFAFGPQLFADASGSVSADRAVQSQEPPADSSAPSSTNPRSAAIPQPAVPAPAAPELTDPGAGVPTAEPVVTGPAAPATPAAPAAPTRPATPVPTATPTPAPTPPVASPPTAPTVNAPLGRTETAATTLPASGRAAPKARIVVSAVSAGTSAGTSVASRLAPASASSPTTASIVVGSTSADATGAWALTLDLSTLGDGAWSLGFVQATAAGTSTAASSIVTIDRTALAPVPAAPDTGSGAYAGLLSPILSGTAEPGATVEVSDHGVVQDTVTAAADGTWTTDQLAGVQPDFSVSARQTDRLGNVSVPSAPVTGSVAVPQVTIEPLPDRRFLLTVTGVPGAEVRLFADGTGASNVFRLDQYGHASELLRWRLDDTLVHRFGTAYFVGDRRGVLVDQPVTLF